MMLARLLVALLAITVSYLDASSASAVAIAKRGRNILIGYRVANPVPRPPALGPQPP